MTPSIMVRAALVLLVVGIAVALIGDGTTPRAIGLAIGGVGGVVLVAAVFLAVGLGEDRERAERDGPPAP